MEHYVGLDVSLKLTAICIVDQTGKVVHEGMVPSDPEAIAAFIQSHAPHVARVGLETGATATWLWSELKELGLPSWVKTSGSKGFHIVVPLDGKTEMGQVAAFAHAVGALLVKREPGTLTQEFHKVDRAGRILVDTGRNGYSATFAAPYAVRAKPGAPVSAPCTWEEVEQGGVTPRTFTLRTMAARLDAVGDVWSDLRRSRRSLRRAIDRLRDTLD